MPTIVSGLLKELNKFYWINECQIIYKFIAISNNGGKIINVYEIIPNKWEEAQKTM